MNGKYQPLALASIALTSKKQSNAIWASYDRRASKAAYAEFVDFLGYLGVKFKANGHNLTITAGTNSIKFIWNSMGLSISDAIIDEDVPEEMVKEIKARIRK